MGAGTAATSVKSVSTATSGSAGASKTAALSWTGWNILSNPIDPTQETDLPFGYRSQWLQPWRAYLDTRPASMLRNAVGINFNVSPAAAAATAQTLAQSGFTRARVEISWNDMSLTDPGQLSDPASVDTLLGALKATGIRPLIDRKSVV